MKIAIKEEAMNSFIDEHIVSRTDEGQQAAARDRIKAILEKYGGRDIDALSILAYAAEQQKFEEFAGKLEEGYEKHLSHLHPQQIQIGVFPNSAESFLVDCYTALGIKTH